MALITHGEWLDRFGDEADAAYDASGAASEIFDSLAFSLAPALAAYGLPLTADVPASVLHSRSLSSYAAPPRLS